MQGLNLMILLVALGSASACKYYCRTPGTFKYECCDDGNPYYDPEAEAEETKPATDNCSYWCLNPNTTQYECCDDGNPYFDGEVSVALPSKNDGPTQPPSDCYYFCAYDGEVYCCGDASQPIPESHAEHEGSCADEDEQVCKKTGVFLVSKKYKAKTSGALRLVAGEGKEKPFCASDGYCGEYEKCCPSKCKRGHICMKALDDDDEDVEE